MVVLLTAALLVLSVVSGMLGIGVAFAAIPFLSLYLPDLVNQVQPLSLALNGVTAFFSMIGFAQGGYVDWRKGGALAVCTTLAAPVGSYCARLVAPWIIWAAYFAAVIFLCYRLFRPAVGVRGGEHFGAALLWAVPISILSGFLGVGPGFLLMPALMIFGFEARRAAALNAVAVTPSSFAATLPHLGHAQIDATLAVPLVVAGAVGSFVGARLAGSIVSDRHLRHVFGVLVVGITLYRLVRLVV